MWIIVALVAISSARPQNFFNFPSLPYFQGDATFLHHQNVPPPHHLFQPSHPSIQNLPPTQNSQETAPSGLGVPQGIPQNFGPNVAQIPQRFAPNLGPGGPASNGQVTGPSGLEGVPQNLPQNFGPAQIQQRFSPNLGPAPVGPVSQSGLEGVPQNLPQNFGPAQVPQRFAPAGPPQSGLEGAPQNIPNLPQNFGPNFGQPPQRFSPNFAHNFDPTYSQAYQQPIFKPFYPANNFHEQTFAGFGNEYPLRSQQPFVQDYPSYQFPGNYPTYDDTYQDLDAYNKIPTFRDPIQLIPSRFPPGIESLVNRIQNYFSVYNPQLVKQSTPAVVNTTEAPVTVAEESTPAPDSEVITTESGENLTEPPASSDTDDNLLAANESAVEDRLDLEPKTEEQDSLTTPEAETSTESQDTVSESQETTENSEIVSTTDASS